MPSIRRRTKARSNWTWLDYEAVASGHDFFGSFVTEDDWLDAWKDMKENLLSAFVAQCPGQRPHCWWEFEAPERRRCTDGAHLFENPEREAHLRRIAATLPAHDRERYFRESNKLWFGVPSCLCIKSDFGRTYESEPEYLDRLGLLEESERRYFAEFAGAWEPRDFDVKLWLREMRVANV